MNLHVLYLKKSYFDMNENFMSKIITLSSVSLQFLTFSTDLFASFICKWVKNSELYQAPSLPLSITQHAMLFIFICLPLFKPSVTVLRHTVCVSGCLGSAYQIGRKCFLSLSASHCLLVNSAAFVSGQKLHQTGNLQVAIVIQASPCLIPHKQTPTPPITHLPASLPLCFQPTAQLCIPCSHWLDGCSVTTPPC